MKTIMTIQKNKTLTRTKKKYKKNTLFRLYNDFIIEYDSSFIGYGAISIIAQSCYASIAAMYILKNMNSISEPTQIIQLFLVTICSIGFNAMVISVQKAKIQINVLISSILISTIFLCSNIF